MTTTLTTQARAFADACHTNALDELRAALRGPADVPDCQTWGLTAQEWRAAIEIATRERAT